MLTASIWDKDTQVRQSARNAVSAVLLWKSNLKFAGWGLRTNVWLENQPVYGGRLISERSLEIQSECRRVFLKTVAFTGETHGGGALPTGTFKLHLEKVAV